MIKAQRNQPQQQLLATYQRYYKALLALRILLALLPLSYIHPDEWYQSVEPMAKSVLGLQVNLSWEFTTDAPIRTILYPYVIVGAVYQWLIQLLRVDALLELLHISSRGYTLFLCSRLVPTVLSLAFDRLIAHLCQQYLHYTTLQTQQVLLVWASLWSVLVLSTRTFSNVMEMYLVTLTQWLVLSVLQTASSKQPARQSQLLILLGVVIAFGSFLRITYPFFVLPALVYLVYIQHLSASSKPLFNINKFVAVAIQRASAVCVGLLPAVTALIALDSWYYTGLQRLIVTPWNNAIYNSNPDNLALHGIHPRYLHITVNMLLLGGPLYVISVWQLVHAGYINASSINSRAVSSKQLPIVQHTRVILIACALSGLFVMSLAPHQEARFCLPLLPALCMLFAPATANQSSNESGSLSPSKPSMRSHAWATWQIGVWAVFNIALLLVYGVLHQGGSVRSLIYFQQHLQQFSTPAFIVYYQTYLPSQSLLYQPVTSEQLQLKDYGSLDYRMFRYSLANEYDNWMEERRVETQDGKHTSDPRCSSNMYLITPGSISFESAVPGEAAALQFTQMASFFPHISFEVPPWQPSTSAPYDVVARQLSLMGKYGLQAFCVTT